MKNLWLTGAVAVLAMASGCVGLSEKRAAARMKDRPAPDFELAALDGGTVRLTELRGKPVVLAFWAFG